MRRQHGVNANQVFYWRKLYRAGQLGDNEHAPGVLLLPVSASDNEPSQTASEKDALAPSGVSINIEIPGRALVSGEGAVDAAIVPCLSERRADRQRHSRTPLRNLRSE